MALVCESAPNPLVLDLQGDLEAFKKQAFVLKEGVEYKIKISFKVNKEIVSGLKYVQQTFRKGMKSESTTSDVFFFFLSDRPQTLFCCL
ncbi:hypothetical protein ILYODFUR_029562 [Ilyodon furcidens]|uniref:Rho GDP-dissociation inhibitor 1 n=1 Tax=Ilyodon furcidens TaxID=33524 RepID=A0ABV0TPE3_9TELE